MQNRKKRILWLLNHVTLMKTEIPIMLSMGYEVFIPKIIPEEHIFRSAAVDFSYDQHLTLPNNVLHILNSTDFYTNDWPEDVIQYINEYFSALFIIPMEVPVKNGLLRFKGVILLRTFGLELNLTYIDLLKYLHRDTPKWLYTINDRFWFASAYEQLSEIEPPLLANRDIYLPISIPSSFDAYKDTWKGNTKQIMFVCPSIETIDHYKKAYVEFKRNFGDLPHIIVGSQSIPVDDPHVLGFVSDEKFISLLQTSAVMYYHSHEPRHVHYHPVEAALIGIPVVLYNDNLVARMAGQPLHGAVSSLKDARLMVQSVLEGNGTTIHAIKNDQEIIYKLFSEAHCREVWKATFESAGLSKYMQRTALQAESLSSEEIDYKHVPNELLRLPNEKIDLNRTLEDGIDFSSRDYPHFIEYIDGISDPEQWGAWSDGDRIDIAFSEPLVGVFDLEITGGAYGQNLGVDIDVKVGHTQKSVMFEMEPWHPTTVKARFNLAEPSRYLSIHIPFSVDVAGDGKRKIGIGLTSIKVKRV